MRVGTPTDRMRRGAGVVAAIAATSLLAACGSSSNDNATTAAAGSGGATTTAAAATNGGSMQDVLDKGYAGVFDPLPTDGPKAVTGKNVWYISCGEAFTACSEMSQAFRGAGKVLGWKVTVADSKATPAVANGLIKQAVAAKADGIVISDSDCPGAKSALLQAKAAKIPVVNYASLDCNDPDYGGSEPLFTASVKLLGSTDQGLYFQNWGKARAQYLLAKLNGKTGKILSIGETSQLIQRHAVKGFEDEIASGCPKCDLVKVPFTFAQVPTQSTAIFKSALLKNPDAVALSFNLDTLMALGLQTALQQNRRPNMIVVGGEGYPVNWPFIKQGLQTASIGFPYRPDTWAEADVMNRIFAGEAVADLPNEGGGYQFIDKEHNLPSGEEQFGGAVDYEAHFTKLWTGQ
jgi:ribose transport system substrate-binding protein